MDLSQRLLGSGSRLLPTRLKNEARWETQTRLVQGLFTLGVTVQEREDLFRGDLFNGTITEFPDKPFGDGPLKSQKLIRE